MWPNPQFLTDSVIFTEEILNGKLLYLSSVMICFCGLVDQRKVLSLVSIGDQC